MNQNELDNLFRTKTRSERYYLENPGAVSSVYQNLEQKQVKGKTVLHFYLPTLKETEILIRKDSRFTSVPDHVHSNLNLNFIYSGKCDYVIDNRPITLYQGDVVIFDKDVIRRKLYAGENDIVINLSMSNEFFDNGFLRQIGEQSILSHFMLHVLADGNDTHDHYMVFRAHKNPVISTLFCQLFAEYYDGRLYSKEMIQGYLHLIFVELLRLYHDEAQDTLVQISSGQVQSTMEILLYLERHFAFCTLEELSGVFGYHPKYISALLKKQTGKTFKEIQLDLRLKACLRLLEDTDRPVQEIFQEVGAGNQNFFYKYFEKNCKKSPSQYRKEHRIDAPYAFPKA